MINTPENKFLFQQYTEFIKTNESLLKADELQTLFFFAINYCIRRLNSGEKEYGVLGLDMYERALNNNTLLIDGYLSRFTYRNIAMMAIRSDQFDWAEKFSHEHVELLRKDDKESAYHFNLALINYFKSNFEDALSHIQEADFKDHLIHLAAKTLQAKIYYELKASKALDSVLDSVDIYLTRNKILGYHKHNYKNIIKYFKRLSRHNPYDKDARTKLRERIQSEEILTEKAWLVEKLS